MDRLKAMEVFAQVVKLGGFAPASRALNLSTTAVSRHVRQLEDAMGVRLLHRTTRRIQLTDVGVAYFERCARVVTEVEELHREIRDQQAMPTGLLRVSVPLSFGHHHLMPALPGFLNRHPGLALNLLLTDHHVDLIADGIDVALRITDKLDENLVARRLVPCRFAVVASPAYLARHNALNGPAELANHNCILDSNVPASDRWPFRGPTGAYQVAVRGNLIVSSADAARKAALSGLGITLIPTFMVGDDLAQGRLVALFRDQVTLATTAYAVYPHHRYLTAKVRVFIDFLRELFDDPPYWDHSHVDIPVSLKGERC